MMDTLTLTIIFIFICTFIAAFIKGRIKDKCLIDFSNDIIHLEKNSGKLIWGRLNIESTGLELIYTEEYKDKSGHSESSYIIYKHEFPNIQILIRYHDDLDEESKKVREKNFKKIYHPSIIRKFRRKFLNIFKTVRDSLMEVINLYIGHVKNVTSYGSIITSQDKYTSKVKSELINFISTAFEPLLEKYIGKIIVFELNKGDIILEFPGILKDYSSDFIEIWDVNYKTDKVDEARKADIIVPRRLGIIRHCGE